MSRGHLDHAHMRHLLKEMIRIRHFEAKCVELYQAQKILGFLHLYDGEEAVSVGTMQALTSDDAVVATYREHGQALARGIPSSLLMAEMLGKVEGCCRGRGGSMHFFDRGRRFYGGNAIVGGGLPLAAGIALGDRMQGRKSVTACFFGDGASNEGTFHESLNLAAVWKLPVVFVCENNGFGEFTPMQTVTSVKDIAVRAKAYDIPGHIVDGNDVLEVYRYASEAIARARAGEGPTLLECKTYRWEGHVVGEQAFLGTGSYRSEQEVNEWKARCPLIRFDKFAAESGKISVADLQRIKKETEAELEEAVKFARESPLPDASEVTEDVFTD